MEMNVLFINGKMFRFTITPGRFQKIFPEFRTSLGGENQRFFVEECQVGGQAFFAEIRFWRGRLKEIRFTPCSSFDDKEEGVRKACDEWLFLWLGTPQEKNKDATYYKCPWGYAAVEYDPPEERGCHIVIRFNR